MFALVHTLNSTSREVMTYICIHAILRILLKTMDTAAMEMSLIPVQCHILEICFIDGKAICSLQNKLALK